MPTSGRNNTLNKTPMAGDAAMKMRPPRRDLRRSCARGEFTIVSPSADQPSGRPPDGGDTQPQPQAAWPDACCSNVGPSAVTAAAAALKGALRAAFPASEVG